MEEGKPCPWSGTLSAGQHLRNSLRRQEHLENPLFIFKLLIFKPIFLLARLLL
ncbi:hypothetical protein [Azorhizophilus paspali]|uniref:Uncharacterized protein n=1 Tax=Azorhizophilus paspali TaxID=69963 RepID=A0ABV6SJS3_AZOPA